MAAEFVGEMQQPNVVVVIADDLGWGDIARHGNEIVRTPNLDALHDRSVRLTRYSSGPMCTPARASLVTGRYHQRTRANDVYCGWAMLDPSETTMGQVFKDAGYATGLVGKWHLGDAYPMRPVDFGYDETLLHGGGGIGQPGDHPDNFLRGAEAYFDPVLTENGVPTRKLGYCTDVLTTGAIEFVSRHRDKPFLLHLATNAPHTPLVVPNELVQPYRDLGVNEVHARLYATVENLDLNIGRLLRCLDENTIVLFTSDHGPCPSSRDFAAPPDRQVRFNAGFRGEKTTLYEGGIRVPCWWSWPSGFGENRDVDRIAHVCDAMPTLAGAAGISIPSSLSLDGVDLGPLLKSEIARGEWPERTLFMQWHPGPRPERYRDFAVITQSHKLYRDELYDLNTDPGERTDLAAVEPQRVAYLRECYDRWFDEIDRSYDERPELPRIVIGSDHEAVTTLSRHDWRPDIALAEIDEPNPGFSRRLPARWELYVERAEMFDFEVRLQAALFRIDELQDVYLSLNDEILSTRRLWGCDVYRWSGIPLKAGRLNLRSWAEGRGSPRDAALSLHVGRSGAVGRLASFVLD